MLDMGTATACSPQQQVIATAFIIVNAIGLGLLALVFCTAWFSKKISRFGTWFLFIFSYMFYCTSYLLLSGHQCEIVPPRTLCNLQAALIYAVPVLASTSTLAYVTEVFLGLVRHIWDMNIPPYVFLWLNVLPILISNFILIEALLVAIDSQVEPNPARLYCHIVSTVPSTVTSIIVCLPLLGVVVLQGWIAVILWRHWNSFRRLSRARTPGVMSITTLARLGGFAVVMPLVVFSLVIGAMRANATEVPHARVWDFVLPSLPLIAALVFGTQKDMLQYWLQLLPSKKAIIADNPAKGPLEA